MSVRLYYRDPYAREFDATVVRVEPCDGLARVWLDRTAFYPTSGGQPFDTGTLDTLAVVDVFEDDDGTVVHVVEAGPSAEPAGSSASASSSAILQAGQQVQGLVDWERRVDHMQQHTGQHVLSAAFSRLFNVATVSFHMGAEFSTIDLGREVTSDEIAAAEGEANRIVWEDRPVGVRFASAEEAAQLPLRKESVRTGTLRLIEVEAFDLSACGGTHGRRTGAVGIIATSAWERFKGGSRVEFVCGARALRRFRSLRDLATNSVRLLSVLPEDVPGAIERMREEAKEERRTIAGLQAELARYRADRFAEEAEQTARGRLVLQLVDGDASALKSLASAVTSRPGYLAVLVSDRAPALAVVARSEDVDMSANQVLAALTAAFGGRGGGKPNLAQGGGLSAPPDSILDEARRLIVG